MHNTTKGITYLLNKYILRTQFSHIEQVSTMGI